MVETVHCLHVAIASGRLSTWASQLLGPSTEGGLCAANFLYMPDMEPLLQAMCYLICLSACRFHDDVLSKISAGYIKKTISNKTFNFSYMLGRQSRGQILPDIDIYALPWQREEANVSSKMHYYLN